MTGVQTCALPICTLISPRHLIYADHYQIPHGTELRFVAPNNTHVSRVLTNSMRIPGTDLHVGVLDANVPTNVIGFAKVLPADFADSLAGIPALGLNQFEQALVVDIAGIRPDHWIQFAIPADPARKQFYRDKISGDSGQPAFLILHGQLVILTVWTGGGPGSGYFIPSYANQINAAMQSLGGHHQLTTVDFTEVSRVSVPQ